jgi:branched-chain amino acid transport system substrate-binding protein
VINQTETDAREENMHGRLIASFIAFSVTMGNALAADTIKIAYSSVGEVALKHFQWLAEQANASGGLGKKVEIVALDNKTNTQESIVQAQKAIDQGMHFILQGQGSSVAAALTDFVAKNNDRNPDKQVLS